MHDDFRMGVRYFVRYMTRSAPARHLHVLNADCALPTASSWSTQHDASQSATCRL